MHSEHNEQAALDSRELRERQGRERPLPDPCSIERSRLIDDDLARLAQTIARRERDPPQLELRIHLRRPRFGPREGSLGD